MTHKYIGPNGLSCLSPILLRRDLICPRCLTQANRQMHQHTPIISTMPMRRPSRTRHNVPDTNSLRLPTLVADPAAPRLHFQDLTILMRVPVCACPRQEGDVVAHDTIHGACHFVHVDVACEGIGSFGGAGPAAGLGGVADDCAGHVEVLYLLRLM